MTVISTSISICRSTRSHDISPFFKAEEGRCSEYLCRSTACSTSEEGSRELQVAGKVEAVLRRSCRQLPYSAAKMDNVMRYRHFVLDISLACCDITILYPLSISHLLLAQFT